MIHTVAELLQALQEREKVALSRFHGVGHQGMIGDMYEGLTRELLSRAVFDGLDLRVVTGKVRMPDGSFSKQIDAMDVRGEGESMPHTDHHIYPPEQIIAAVEVKKTLYGAELDDAYQNLRSLDISAFANSIPTTLWRFVYRKVAFEELPDDLDLGKLPWEKEQLALALMWDVAMPVRVVFGYDGFASEHRLREGFVSYLERVLRAGRAAGYAPMRFPSLVVCGQRSLVKLNGMPFSASVEGTDEWLVYSSYATRPVGLLLEVLWTRLHNLGLVGSEVFGDDLAIEHLNPLLFAKALQDDRGCGWHYRYEDLSASQLSASRPVVPWEPLRLTDHEAVLMLHLLRHLRIDTQSDAFWREWAAEAGDAVSASLQRLRASGIAAMDEQRVVTLLTEHCQLVVDPEIGYVIAENSTGRLTRWIQARATSGAAEPPSLQPAGTLDQSSATTE